MKYDFKKFGLKLDRILRHLAPLTITLLTEHRAIDIFNVKIDFYISPQTLDQYWSTLVFAVALRDFPLAMVSMDCALVLNLLQRLLRLF